MGFCFRVCIYWLVSKIRRELQQSLELPREQKGGTKTLFNNKKIMSKRVIIFDKPTIGGGGFVKGKTTSVGAYTTP